MLQLKKKLGQQDIPQTIFPHVTVEGIVQAMPEAILERCLVKKHGRATVEVLVEWQGVREEDSTWENYDRQQASFPEINLEDKVALRGEEWKKMVG